MTVAPELFVTSALEQIIEQIVTEDDTPVDNIFSEKQQRLLVEPLYSSWQTADRIFVATANVGLFNAPNSSPIVPDMLLSMNVEVGENWYEKRHRSYFVWEFKKPPEVVVEIVSNKKGKEADEKLQAYALIGVRYYVIYDPLRIIQSEELKVFELSDREVYRVKPDNRLDKVELSLTLWRGVFENKYAWWLRWSDMEGELIQTGFEKSKSESERAEHERERAEYERERAEYERERAEKLAAQLRALGIEPE